MHAIHRHREQGLIGPAGAADFVLGPDRPGLVDVTEDDAAEDRAVGIGVPGHHHDFHGEVPLTTAAMA